MQTYRTGDRQATSIQVYNDKRLRGQWSRLLQEIKHGITYLWEGSPTFTRALRLEWRMVAIRWLGILILAPTLPLLNLSSWQLAGAYAVLLVSIIYNLTLQILLVRRSTFFLSGYMITICDALLDIAIIALANGFDSPFYYILYTVTVATAMRYSYGPVLAVALMFVSADALESLIRGLALGPAFIFRSSFLVITSMIAGYLHEQAQEAEEALEERLNEANALNKELEAFSYSVSHDLRAPLRSINGFSQALLEDYGDELDEEAQDYLGRVNAASQHMAELIDDLLNLSRVTRSEMTRKKINLSKLASEVSTNLRQLHPEYHIDIRFPDNIRGNGDSQLLQVVLDNLFNNAWKFSKNTPHPSIQFGVTQHGGEEAYFVSDNGVGFDMAYAHKLFGAFQRLHSVSEFEGNGIGLATVQRIINRHGGKVWGESVLGQGATFYFTL